MRQSKKKVKGGVKGFTWESSQPVCYDDLVESPRGSEDGSPRASYRDKVLGRVAGERRSELEEDFEEWMEATDKEVTEENAEIENEWGEEEPGITTIKGKLGQYECPSFVLS